jgi:hypothetical protein
MPQQCARNDATRAPPASRSLARLEEEDGLVLTPFERNLEVWRQLWRVLERSDVVVQVVDARDPLTYWSDSLAAYAADIHATKASLVLLNKADLLPAAARRAWADWFDARGRRYVFWSAAAAADEQARARAEASALGLPAPAPAAEVRAAGGAGALQEREQRRGGGGGRGGGDERIRVLGVEELLEVLEGAAREAVEAADEDDPRRWARGPGNRWGLGPRRRIFALLCEFFRSQEPAPVWGTWFPVKGRPRGWKRALAATPGMFTQSSDVVSRRAAVVTPASWLCICVGVSGGVRYLCRRSLYTILCWKRSCPLLQPHNPAFAESIQPRDHPTMHQGRRGAAAGGGPGGLP